MRSKYGVPRGSKPSKQSRYRHGIFTNEMRRKYYYRTGIKLGDKDPVPIQKSYRKYPPFPILPGLTKNMKWIVKKK